MYQYLPHFHLITPLVSVSLCFKCPLWIMRTQITRKNMKTLHILCCQHLASRFKMLSPRLVTTGSTNKAFCCRVFIEFIGCASHGFNLSVKDIIHESLDEVGKVQKLMKNLRTPILAGKLRAHTPLKAKVNNDTRWSSVFHLLKRFI